MRKIIFATLIMLIIVISSCSKYEENEQSTNTIDDESTIIETCIQNINYDDSLLKNSNANDLLNLIVEDDTEIYYLTSDSIVSINKSSCEIRRLCNISDANDIMSIYYYDGKIYCNNEVSIFCVDTISGEKHEFELRDIDKIYDIYVTNNMLYVNSESEHKTVMYSIEDEYNSVIYDAYVIFSTSKYIVIDKGDRRQYTVRKVDALTEEKNIVFKKWGEFIQNIDDIYYFDIGRLVKVDDYLDEETICDLTEWFVTPGPRIICDAVYNDEFIYALSEYDEGEDDYRNISNLTVFNMDGEIIREFNLSEFGITGTYIKAINDCIVIYDRFTNKLYQLDIPMNTFVEVKEPNQLCNK